MSEFIKEDKFARGVNNRAHEKSVPEGFVRDAVNVDFLADDVVALRSGYRQVYQGTEVRGALAIGDSVLIADGTMLVRYNAETDSASVIGTIAGAGLFAGTEFNAELFFCTENECLRYKNGVLRRWGVPTVTAQPVPTVTTGGLRAGTYQLAMTWVNEYGEEGGTVGAINITVPADSGLQVTLPVRDGHTPRLYVSAVDGGTLYWQPTGAGTHLINTVRTDTERLETMHMREPVPSAQVGTCGAMLTMVDGAVLWTTDPMHPHLRSPMRGFAQFAEPIGFVGEVAGGIYVSADKVVFLSGLDTDEPQQTTVLPYPGVPGTLVTLPATKGQDTERVAWMTKDGLAIGGANGQVELISQEGFLPQLAESGSSGIVTNNGNQMVVTNLRGGRGKNPLMASDYYEAEIIAP